MIDRFKIRNSIGEYYTIKLREPEKSGFLIASVSGLSSPAGSISSSDYALFDGSVFGNSKVGSRNIVFDIIFYPNKKTIEELRRECYDIFQVKDKIKLYIYKDDENGTCYSIEGFVELNKTEIFSKAEGAQISIICPDPYFTIETNGMSYPAYLSNIVPKFQFPVCIGTGITTIQNIYWPEYNDSDYSGNEVMVAGREELKDYVLTLNEDGGYTLVAPNANKITTENEEGGLTAIAVAPDPILVYDPNAMIADNASFVPPPENHQTLILKYDPMIEFGRIKGNSNTIVTYDGLGEIGISIIIDVLGDISGIKIKNITRGETMEIDSAKVSSIVGNGFQKYDTIKINTTKGNKSVQLLRNGNIYNIMHALTSSSKWIYIQTGKNKFSYTTTSGFGNAFVHFDYKTKTLGV